MNPRYGVALLILIPTMLLLSAAVAVALAWRFGRDTVLTKLDAEQIRSCESLFRLRLPPSAETNGFHMRVAAQTTAHWRLTLSAAELPELVRASPFVDAEWRVLSATSQDPQPYPEWWTPTLLPGTRTASAGFVDQGFQTTVQIWTAEIAPHDKSQSIAESQSATETEPASASAPVARVIVFLEWRREEKLPG